MSLTDFIGELVTSPKLILLIFIAAATISHGCEFDSYYTIEEFCGNEGYNDYTNIKPGFFVCWTYYSDIHKVRLSEVYMVEDLSKDIIAIKMACKECCCNQNQNLTK